uniref:Mitochondrial inner membrane protein Mpv17 n=1 Tax=Glossina pallidipes TaxID=7398 RepID=A0A1A9ZMY8_GLOPL
MTHKGFAYMGQVNGTYNIHELLLRNECIDNIPLLILDKIWEWMIWGFEKVDPEKQIDYCVRHSFKALCSYFFGGCRTAFPMGSGDLLAQHYGGAKNMRSINWIRTITSSSIGLFFIGPALTYWSNIMHPWSCVQRNRTFAVFKQIISDQIYLAPSLNLGLVCLSDLTNENRYAGMERRIFEKYMFVMKRHYVFWSAVQFVIYCRECRLDVHGSMGTIFTSSFKYLNQVLDHVLTFVLKVFMFHGRTYAHETHRLCGHQYHGEGNCWVASFGFIVSKRKHKGSSSTMRYEGSELSNLMETTEYFVAFFQKQHTCNRLPQLAFQPIAQVLHPLILVYHNVSRDLAQVSVERLPICTDMLCGTTIKKENANKKRFEPEIGRHYTDKIDVVVMRKSELFLLAIIRSDIGKTAPADFENDNAINCKVRLITNLLPTNLHYTKYNCKIVMAGKKRILLFSLFMDERIINNNFLQFVIILPNLQIMREMLSFAIQCLDADFKDLTAIDHLIRTYNLLHYFPKRSQASNELESAKQEIYKEVGLNWTIVSKITLFTSELHLEFGLNFSSLHSHRPVNN